MKKLIVLLMLVSLALLTACASQDTPNVMAFTDASKPISVKTNETFAIELQSNRTTGYSWELPTKPDGTVVTFLISEYVAPNSGVPGAGGKEVWTFKGAAAGNTTLTLIYHRPFEKDVPPVNTITFKVTVR